MSRRISHFLAAVMLSMALMLLAGCPYESDLPLSPPSEAVMDKDLIGTWTTADKDDSPGTLTIVPFNDHEVLIVIEEKGGTKREMLRAFTTPIGKERFLNIQGIEEPYDKRKWVYLNYSVTKDTLTYRIVCDSFLKDRISKASTSKEIYQVIRENLSNKDLYDKEETTLRRINMR
jgi:hypothetical protein